jgi:hypothetical protein
MISFVILGTGLIAGKLLNNTGNTNYLPIQLFTRVYLIITSLLYLAARLLISRKAVV